ncbi:hypothetical protein WR25_01487 [Diploscapter pachys]|uniref:Aminopeptidase n=1 Tax=Diploscapter pachys TaxID=2018661 RepID=A0A2A2JR53_9BILA|nr:hypothetical protein WR25_01487 [Diploscapter pachys]
MACPVPVKEKYERLPLFAKPSHYHIQLKPNFSNFTFEGEVSVEFEILETTDFLKLHAVDLAVHNVSLTAKDGNPYPDLQSEYSVKTNMLTVKLPKKFEPQKMKLTIKYTGELNNKMHGFYRSSYKNEKDEEKWMATTQFESTHARNAFPCWDEPIYKAQFDVTFVVESYLTALSNMNVIESKPLEDGKFKQVKFATSPIMSTYLVAFAVGDFEFIESKTQSGCVVRVYTVPGKKEQGSFALDLATKAIDWYNNWFGITYPLPKCDLIGIPDFSMGAMENWGLVTYREVYLLIDSKVSSTRMKMNVALVVAHELAHLWFGDLVTMQWWTDLWLKEGFASFMEYLFVGYNCEEFKIWLHFINDEFASGLGLDSLRSSHPIEVEIDNPNELEEIYDSITYAKSNSVNRMLCFYLGEETFQKGLRIYLKRFSYKNATTEDLWTALSEASGQNISELMSGWTKQMGFPVVSVSQTVNGRERQLHLKQNRFIADGGQDSNNQIWQVPINISTSSDPSRVKQRILMKGREETVTVSDVDPNEWIKLNTGATGFYRVEYSSEMLTALLPDIASGNMPIIDRFNIANDLFALVLAGRQTASSFLQLLEASLKEEEYIVWSALDEGLAAFSNVLIDADADGSLKKRFDAYVSKILAPIGEKLGWEVQPGEDAQLSLLRSLIQGRLAKAGHQPTIGKILELFENHATTKAELHPDLRSMIYSSAARNGGEKVFIQLQQIYETIGFTEIERHCITALSATQEHALLEKAFKYGFDENKIRMQDLYLLFLSPSATKVGQAFAWSYFKSHMQQLIEKFGGVGNGLFQRCFKWASENFCSEEMAKDVEDLFCKSLAASDLATLDRPIRQATESIRTNAKLKQNNVGPLDEFFKSKGF